MRWTCLFLFLCTGALAKPQAVAPAPNTHPARDNSAQRAQPGANGKIAIPDFSTSSMMQPAEPRRPFAPMTLPLNQAGTDAQSAFRAPALSFASQADSNGQACRLLAQNGGPGSYPTLFPQQPVAKLEPIPGQWPNAKFELIPTTWPNLKLVPIASRTSAPETLQNLQLRR